jgi:hypothetical protein
MSEQYFVRTLGGLAPVDENARQALRAIGQGEVVRIKLHRDRNPRHHRLFFALLNLVFDNQDKYLSIEALRFAVTIQAGYVEEIRLRGDAVTLKPKSLAFGSMDQNEFKTFYQAAMKAIPELLPQFQGVDLERELIISGGI